MRGPSTSESKGFLIVGESFTPSHDKFEQTILSKLRLAGNSADNQRFFRLCASSNVLIATRDADRYPTRLAATFRASDREVLDHGHAVIERLEVWYTAAGALDWCVVTKLPLHDRRGRIIGVMMVMRPWVGSRRALALGDGLADLFERIRAEPHLPWRVEALAKRVGLSQRQLHRRFLSSVGIGVKEFILCVRIQHAAELLRERSLTLGAVAHACGFNDQSAFTRAFRDRTGTTPERYRLGAGA